MLYNIIPPLLFFISLGGIIVILSRVVLRLRREQVSVAIQQEGAALSPAAHNFLTPVSPGLQVVKSRLHVFTQATSQGVKDSIGSLKHYRDAIKQKRQEKTSVVPEPEIAVKHISIPASSWKDRVATAARTAQQAASSSLTFFLSRLASLKKSAPVPSITEKPVVLQMHVVEQEESNAVPVSQEPATAPKSFMAQLLRRSEPVPIYTEAGEALEQEHFQQVEDLLVPYILEHTRDTKAYMILGEAALRGGNYADAMEIFQQVIKLNPQEPGAQASLGLAAFREGRFSVAVQALQRARDVNEASSEVLESLLVIAQRMDNRVLQRSLLQELLVLHPENAGYAEALAGLQAAQAVREH